MLEEGRKSRAAHYIEEHIHRSAFSHAEIAALLGYNTGAVIYKFVHG